MPDFVGTGEDLKANETPMEDSAAPATEALKEFLQEAHDRFQQSAEATAQQRRDGLEDLQFRAGEQWDAAIKNQREDERRPCLVINRLPQFERQVTNDLRQNRPAIIVSPKGEGSTKETAEIFQGLIRDIEYQSNAEGVYDTALASAVRCGFGYLQIATIYSDPMSFEQDIRLKRISNAFKVYFDPSCQEFDYSDAKWAFIVEDFTKPAYKAQWPDSKLASLDDWRSIGDTAADWGDATTVRVAEYYYIVEEEQEIVMLSDDTVIFRKDMPEKLSEGVYERDHRTTRIPSVKWKLINAVEVLDETDWPGKYIPIVPVLGDEVIVDGKTILESAFRHAKDPQRMLNYWKSAEAEMIALAPKAPFIGAEGQFEGYEKDWKDANIKNKGYLQYKPKTIGSQLAPPPQRNTYEAPIQAITGAAMQTADDLKSTIGIYDPSLGQVGSDQSGKAILARQSQGHTNNFHWGDNLSRALKHVGEILVDLIPKIYDSKRVVRIITESGDDDLVIVNGKFMEDGVDKIYDLNAGKYGVVINAGPSYATRRKEAAASMEAIVSAYPPLMEKAGDLLVRNFDWPGADELADRLKKALPPELQDDKGDPRAAAAMQKANAMIQRLTSEVNMLSQKLENRTADYQSKERVAIIKSQTEILKTLATLESQSGNLAFTEELKHVEMMVNNMVKMTGIMQPQQAQEAQNALDSTLPQDGADSSASASPAPQ